VGDIVEFNPGHRLTNKATRRHTPAPPEKADRDRQIGVDPELGEIIAKYAAFMGMSIKDVAHEAFEVYGVRERYAKMLEQEAARARGQKRENR